tara:strand:+ start:636 stop:887 length:252 start_codon:yes stop_codon:yes gene_type:complete
MLLKTFVLIGVIDSFDSQFATVEINMNPSTNGGPAHAVMPVTAFPCEIDEGQRFYIVKLTEQSDAVIVCNIQDQETTENNANR